MKILAIALLSLQMTIGVLVSNAQTTPPPPTPPSPGGASSYTYTHSKRGKTIFSQEKVSISISNSDDTYMLRAKFPMEKNKEVEDVLLKEMKVSNMRIEIGNQVWRSDSNGEEVYEVILGDTKLTIFLNKEIASVSLVEKFEELGLTVRSILAGGQDEKQRQAEKMQREADRLKAEADRMQAEADRIKKDAALTNPDNVERYIDDATRIAEEADRIAGIAGELNTEASHRGGVSSMVKDLLRANRTAMDSNFRSTDTWTWPAAQKELIAALRKEGDIDTENEISITHDLTGFYVNGEKLTSPKQRRYMEIFSAHRLDLQEGFSFYRKDNHIVLISANANIDGFIADLVKKGFIASKRTKVKLGINGSSVYKDGSQVSQKDLLVYNELMLKHKIIPAPGKVFEIMKAGNYRLGYSVEEKTHFGTWQFGN